MRKGTQRELQSDGANFLAGFTYTPGWGVGFYIRKSPRYLGDDGQMLSVSVTELDEFHKLLTRIKKHIAKQSRKEKHILDSVRAKRR